MKVVPLVDVPHHVDMIAQWIWGEWRGGFAGQTFEDTRTVLLGRPTNPPTLVALEAGMPVGVLGFRRVMFRGREPLQLFINSLFVLASHRSRGLGTALLQDGLRRVGSEDEYVYVYASIRTWYEDRGFVVIEVDGDTGNFVLRARAGGCELTRRCT
jgi:GNAT superfamily N-acetyltransferase